MTSNHSLADTLSALLDEWSSRWPAVPGFVVAVDAPAGSLALARGLADPSEGTALTPDHAARIASCTKPFVASTVLDLTARGLLTLDDLAIAHLDADGARLFAQSPVGSTATVRQLLQHRSGLVDHSYFPEFNHVVDNDPQHEWTALEQLAIAVSKPALFAPDTAFSYSDTGYVLLGQIVEHLTGTPLAAAVRTACNLDALDVPSIHWEISEPTPPGLVRTHQFFEGTDIHDWHPSLDLFGGGGIVANMPDLARWWTALFDGRVHPHVARMIATPRSTLAVDGSVFPGGEAVGVCIFRARHADVPVWSHGGFWGLTTSHIPSRHTSIALMTTGRGEGLPSPTELHRALVEAVLAS
jgi:D-alanyl-D-alanine carboxypeptidase